MQVDHCEQMIIEGRLEGGTFLPWIERHARKLGLVQTVRHADHARIALDLCGPAELIDAMEMGCLLGPIDVWVEGIARSAAPGS